MKIGAPSRMGAASFHGSQAPLSSYPRVARAAQLRVFSDGATFLASSPAPHERLTPHIASKLNVP